MRRAIVLLLASAAVLGAVFAHSRFASGQAAAPESSALASFMPPDALLYLQAKDFSALLADWNHSPEKQRWLKTADYEVFSRSRLLLRLKEASDQFAAAAGLPPDMKFLSQAAGAQSAFALYDIGKLQFVYITRLTNASAPESALWQTRSKFESRSVSGLPFYLRRDPQSQREVAFAIAGDYLVLATREDLLAGVLQRIAANSSTASSAPSSSMPISQPVPQNAAPPSAANLNLATDPWWSQSVAAAGAPGDLRMVLNLEKIVPSPYFRSYWVQQNISEMKQYSSAISDLHRSNGEFREERVLLRKSPAPEDSSSATNCSADLSRLIPANAGFYKVTAAPSPELTLATLQEKLLAPHTGPSAAATLAPSVQLTSGETGNSSDLESRIDQPPAQNIAAAGTASALQDALRKHHICGMLQLQKTERDPAGVFIRIHSAVALLAGSDWDETSLDNSLSAFVAPSLSAGPLGMSWQSVSGHRELDGLWTLATSTRGKYFFLSDDPALLTGLLAALNNPSRKSSAVLTAGFNHARERENFARLAAALDRPGGPANSNPYSAPGPQFFSGNIASLSATFSDLASEKIVTQEKRDKVLQTVTYQWAQ